MFDFHKDKKVYFTYQFRTASEYIIPFIAPHMELNEQTRVLEIGCAEAGVLKAFTDKGCQCTGIELSPKRVELAEQLMADELKAGKVRFMARNIYDIDVEQDLDFKFDLIILKDVIEHIHDQERFMHTLHNFLAPEGKVFFGFPPWQMPFGGHQQICKSKFLSKLPYYHMLPMPVYKGVLKAFGESDKLVADLAEIKDTGISLERFERILKKENYQIFAKQLFLFNPIYEYKFKLKVRKQNPLISGIPYVRNFLTTCGYYLVAKQ